MITMLGQVAEHGSAAQAAAARDLINRLAAAPGSAELRAAASALVDAFLHDPYLTR